MYTFICALAAHNLPTFVDFIIFILLRFDTTQALTAFAALNLCGLAVVAAAASGAGNA